MQLRHVLQDYRKAKQLIDSQSEALAFQGMAVAKEKEEMRLAREKLDAEKEVLSCTVSGFEDVVQDRHRHATIDVGCGGGGMTTALTQATHMPHTHAQPAHAMSMRTCHTCCVSLQATSIDTFSAQGPRDGGPCRHIDVPHFRDPDMFGDVIPPAHMLTA